MQDVTSDDIATLRSRNISDDTILDKLGQYDTEHAKDFQALKDRGVKPSEIVDKYVQYRQANPSVPPSSGTGVLGTLADIGGKAVQAFAHGTREEASRIADSQRYVLGSTPDTLDKAANVAQAVEGQNYDPASNHVGLSADGLSYVPRAAVEAVPSAAGYLGAGAAGGAIGSVVPIIGTTVGSLAGMGLYGLSRYWGRTAKERAANNGHPDQVTGSDVAAALPSSAANAALDTVGRRYLFNNGILSPNLVEGAGLNALKQTGVNFGKSAAVNAATSGASSVIDQAGATVGTDAGTHIDPAEALQAAKAGALVSSALKLPSTIKSGVMDMRQGDTEALVRGDLSRLMDSPRVTGDPNSGGQTDQVITNTRGIIGNDTKDAVAAVKAKIKANQENNQPTADLEAALKTSEDALTNLKSGKLDNAQADSVRLMTGGPEVQALKKQLLMRNELENVADKANAGAQGDSESGILGTGISNKTSLFHGGLSVFYGKPGLAAMYAIPALARMAASKAKSVALGSDQFVPEYVRRFSGQDGFPTPVPEAAPAATAPPPPAPGTLEASGGVQPPNVQLASAKVLETARRKAFEAQAKAEYEARTVSEKPAKTKEAPEVAKEAPKASVTPPESTIAIEPSVKIPNDFVEADIGEHGKRTWHQSTIRKGDNGAAKAAGTKASADIRKAVTEDAAKLKLSPEGKKALPGIIRHLKSINEAGWNDNATSAREQVAKAARGLPEADRAKFTQHFETHTHNGQGFYHSWKHGTKAEKVAGDKKKVAKYRERTTKRAKAAHKATQ